MTLTFFVLLGLAIYFRLPFGGTMKMVDIGYVRSGFGLTIVPRFPFSTLTLHLHESNLNAPPCLEPLKEHLHCRPLTRLLINPLEPRLAIYFFLAFRLALISASKSLSFFLIRDNKSERILGNPPVSSIKFVFSMNCSSSSLPRFV